jgi:secreted Zn-dependent insulinase-like peptidase
MLSDICIEKPQTDDAKYGYLKLDNGISCVLISDHATDKAAASMDVSLFT